MVDAGIIVVASAGNTGKTEAGDPIWGAISSPGNHPDVIPVGAMNHRGTASHADGIATTFSSRGPTFQDAYFIAPQIL